jgi:hypothetical protein
LLRKFRRLSTSHASTGVGAALAGLDVGPLQSGAARHRFGVVLRGVRGSALKTGHRKLVACEEALVDDLIEHQVLLWNHRKLGASIVLTLGRLSVRQGTQARKGHAL